VGRVDWDEQRRILMLTGLTPPVPARTVLCLTRVWGLPEVAVERAGFAKVFDQRISLNGGAGARVVARRRPGGPGVTWLVVLDHGLDPADPRLRAELESVLTELRAATGAEDGAGPEPGTAAVVRSRPGPISKRAREFGITRGKPSRRTRNWATTLAAAWQSAGTPQQVTGTGADLPVSRDQPAGVLTPNPAQSRKGR
jgi:hypothetical protein